MEIKKNLAKYFPFFGFAFIFVGLIFRNIQYSKIPFLEWDEGIYAEIGREVLKGHFLPTTFNNVLWLEKPPLIPGLLAIDFKIFGYSEFWGRMLMVLLAFNLSLLVYFLVRKVLANLNLFNRLSDLQTEIVCFLPVLAVASTSLILDRSTNVSTDLMLAIGWVGFFVCRNSFIGKLVFVVLGVGAKSLLGFYPLILDSLFLLIQKKFRQLLANIIIGLISSVWFIWGYLKYSSQFIELHFYDQLIKRASEPIELHFGGRLYYPQQLLSQLGFMLILIVLGYIAVLFFLKSKVFKKLLKWKDLYGYLILFSWMPFFFFLFFTKSKLYWYLLPIIPFMFLPIGFPAFFLKDKRVLNLFLGIILVALSFGFISKTFLLKTDASVNPKIVLAKCIAKYGEDKVGYLVDAQERQNKNVLEAAHLQTTNSFIYGGTPAFVFYVNKPVFFSYDPVLFKKQFQNYPLVVLTEKDIQNYKFNLVNYKRICSSLDYLGYEKK